MLKKFILLLFVTCCSWCEALSQNLDFGSQSKNAVFLEIGGKGPYYSLNYDRIFYAGQSIATSFRVGFSVLPDGVSLPVALNLITGRSQHHAEFSLGLTPFIDHYKTFLQAQDLSDKYLYITPGVGYRYQKPAGGFYFTAGAAPFIFLDPPSYNVWDVHPKFYFSGQLALGISF